MTGHDVSLPLNLWIRLWLRVTIETQPRNWQKIRQSLRRQDTYCAARDRSRDWDPSHVSADSRCAVCVCHHHQEKGPAGECSIAVCVVCLPCMPSPGEGTAGGVVIFRSDLSSQHDDVPALHQNLRLSVCELCECVCGRRRRLQRIMRMRSRRCKSSSLTIHVLLS